MRQRTHVHRLTWLIGAWIVQMSEYSSSLKSDLQAESTSLCVCCWGINLNFLRDLKHKVEL